MIVLDTDHLTIFLYGSGTQYLTLHEKMRDSDDPFFVTTVISVEEQMRGWLAYVNRHREPRDQIPAYERIRTLFRVLRDWEMLPLNNDAVDSFEQLRQQRIRIGTQDLKIASIALVHDALLLSANLRDFQRVPGLRVESWLAE